MADRPVEFGVTLSAAATDLPLTVAAAGVADDAGLALVGVPDHPYQDGGLDAWTLLTHLAVRTARVRVFPNVACLPLRPPAVLARAAAALDVLSAGRVELGLGTGWRWDAIAALGGPRHTPGEAIHALADAIAVTREQWRAAAPAHRIEIWVGALGSRMLELTGRLADGWSASVFRTPETEFPAIQARLDAAARAAGRDPADVRRILNIRGVIGAGPGGRTGPPGWWADRLGRLTSDGGFDTVVFWPEGDPPDQVERFAAAVVPQLRDDRQHVGGNP